MNSESMPGTGYLTVRVTTAGGAIPLRDAEVIVRGNTPATSGVYYEQRTDRNGLTQKLPLPAPAAGLSGAPGAPGASAPYSTYNIDVSMPGYYRNTYQNVPVFDRISALQPVELIPLSENGIPDKYISDNTRFYESENPNL